MKKIIAAAAALIMALTVCGQSIGAEQYTADAPVKTVSIDLDNQLGAAKTTKTSPPATIKNITNETVIEYKSIKEDFRKEGYGTPALYNFTNQIATGRAADGSVISCETNYYGLKSYIDKVTADATKRVKDKLSGYSALFSIYTKMYNCDIPDDLTVNIWLQKDSNTVY